MILRVFRAVAQPGKGPELERMLREISIPMVDGRDGLIARYSGKPMATNTDEFVMITIWRDLESLRSFAGDDWEQAVIPEDERPMLAQTFIHHYESFDRP